MAVSRLHPWLSKRGRANVSGQSISAAGTYTLSIALGRSDYKQAIVVATIPVSVAGTAQRRRTAHIVCTDTLSQAASQATLITTNAFTDAYYISRSITDSAHSGYFYTADSLVSDRYFSDNTPDDISIQSAQINGSNLEVIFKNNNGSSASSLTVDVEYRAQ